jgi:hypothetical protein
LSNGDGVIDNKDVLSSIQDVFSLGKIMAADSNQAKSKRKETTPLSAWSGSLISGTIAILLYKLTTSIALSYLTHPSAATSQIAQRISAAVRTLVVGLSSLATGLFAIAALGLVLLGFKILFQDLTKASESNP